MQDCLWVSKWLVVIWWVEISSPDDLNDEILRTSERLVHFAGTHHPKFSFQNLLIEIFSPSLDDLNNQILKTFPKTRALCCNMLSMELFMLRSLDWNFFISLRWPKQSNPQNICKTVGRIVLQRMIWNSQVKISQGNCYYGCNFTLLVLIISLCVCMSVVVAADWCHLVRRSDGHSHSCTPCLNLCHKCCNCKLLDVCFNYWFLRGFLLFISLTSLLWSAWLWGAHHWLCGIPKCLCSAIFLRFVKVLRLLSVISFLVSEIFSYLNTIELRCGRKTENVAEVFAVSHGINIWWWGFQSSCRCTY